MPRVSAVGVPRWSWSAPAAARKRDADRAGGDGVQAQDGAQEGVGGGAGQRGGGHGHHPCAGGVRRPSITSRVIDRRPGRCHRRSGQHHDVFEGASDGIRTGRPLPRRVEHRRPGGPGRRGGAVFTPDATYTDPLASVGGHDAHRGRDRRGAGHVPRPRVPRRTARRTRTTTWCASGGSWSRPAVASRRWSASTWPWSPPTAGCAPCTAFWTRSRPAREPSTSDAAGHGRGMPGRRASALGAAGRGADREPPASPRAGTAHDALRRGAARRAGVRGCTHIRSGVRRRRHPQPG